MAQGIPARLTPADGRRFGLTLGLAFLGVGGLVYWRGHLAVAAVFGSLGVVMAIAGLAIPAHLDPVYRAWMALAHALSRVTTPVFMGLLYFVTLTPVGFLRRLFGGNPLSPRGRGNSLWVSRGTSTRGDLQRQF